jgi:hypothetical protein
MFRADLLQLFDQHTPDLQRFLTSRVTCEATAADLAQEAFLRLSQAARCALCTTPEPEHFSMISRSGRGSCMLKIVWALLDGITIVVLINGLYLRWESVTFRSSICWPRPIPMVEGLWECRQAWCLGEPAAVSRTDVGDAGRPGCKSAPSASCRLS